MKVRDTKRSPLAWRTLPGALGIVAALVLLAACASEDAATPPPAGSGLAAVDSSTLRPDPNVPVGGDGQMPPYWKTRFDSEDPAITVGSDGETSDVFFVSMVPGWHITTGPAGIFYHPASTASGVFTAHATIHLFDPAGRNEAFGLFFGGEDLETANQSYEYFLIRNSGEYLIKRRIGSETQLIQDWTPSDAIVRYTDPEVFSVPNTLAVSVGAQEVRFLINDVEVASYPSAELASDGIVGLRVNHALNLHVSEFGVEPGE